MQTLKLNDSLHSGAGQPFLRPLNVTSSILWQEMIHKLAKNNTKMCTHDRFGVKKEGMGGREKEMSKLVDRWQVKQW